MKSTTKNHSPSHIVQANSQTQNIKTKLRGRPKRFSTSLDGTLVEYKPQPRKHCAMNEQLALRIAKASFRGGTHAQIASAVGCGTQTVGRYLRHPDFPAVCQKAREALRKESAESALVGQADSIDISASIIADFKAKRGDIPLGLLEQAMRTIEKASAPTPERYAAQARKELLLALSPSLRKQVLDELSGKGSSYLDDLGEEDLEALLAQ